MKNIGVLFVKRHMCIVLSFIMIVTACVAFVSPSAYAADKPAKVKGIKVVSGFEAMLVTWKPVRGKNIRYEIRQGNKVRATDLKETKARIWFNPYPAKPDGEAMKISFDVFAYYETTVKDAKGKAKKVKVYSDKNTVWNVQPVHPMYVVFQTTSKAYLYPTAGTNKAVGAVGKGSQMVAFGGSRSPSNGSNERVLVRIKGKTYYIKSEVISIIKMRYNSREKFNKTTFESFVNDANLKSYPKSGPKRLIWVSTYQQKLYLFTWNYNTNKWVIDSRYPKGLWCNTGKDLTPYGVMRITGKWEKKPSTGTKWWSTFNAIGIHQKLREPLGMPASGGCIRIATDEARWFYYNIARGTTVFVY